MNIPRSLFHLTLKWKWTELPGVAFSLLCWISDRHWHQKSCTSETNSIFFYCDRKKKKKLTYEYGIVNYKHNVVSLISRTFSYCENETPFFLTFASGKHHFTFCFHGLDYYRYLTGVESKTILL